MQASLERLRQRREEMGDEGGFTLIELLIVVVVLGILAAIVVFAVDAMTGSSARASCESDFQTVDHAVQSYKGQVGAWPASIANLQASKTLSDNSVVGPWLHTTPTNTNHYNIIIDPAKAGQIDVQTWSGTAWVTGATNFDETAGTAAPSASSMCTGVS